MFDNGLEERLRLFLHGHSAPDQALKPKGLRIHPLATVNTVLR